MQRFNELSKETGVDLLNSFMVVGLKGANLLLLQDAHELDLRYDRHSLDVSLVTQQTAGAVSNLLRGQFVRWNLMDEDSADSYWGAMHASLRFSKHSRLLLVSGKSAGVTSLSAVSGRTKVDLEVAVLSPKYFNVAFRFLQLRDDSGNVGKTQWGPSDSRWLVNKLNWVYGPQANISFQLADSDWVNVDVNAASVDVTQPLQGTDFLKYVAGSKSKNADLTVFFVQKYITVDKRGFSETFLDQNICVVEDKPPLPVIKGADPFLVDLAHEVAHFLRFDENPIPLDDHHNRPNVLLSRAIQSARVDKELVKKINSPN
jgi:hypothetical protein